MLSGDAVTFEDEDVEEHTRPIEVTDAMIKESFSNEQKQNVETLDAIPGIGIVNSEQIIAETGVDMSALWSKMNTILCKRRIRVKDALPSAISYALNMVSSADCRAWFHCAGY